MNKMIVIVGPTGVGKTKLSIELAKKYNGEVINADSTQVYKGLDIATAKITETEKEGIVHHLLDIIDITEDYSVYDYQQDCRRIIAEIRKKNKVPIIVGGTGLYIKAALYDYQFNNENYKNNYEELTGEQLYERLITRDADSLIHPHNRKRIIGALNYYETNQKPMSAKGKNDVLLYDVIVVGLTTNRQLLYERINERVNIMVQSGLIAEAKNIYDQGISTKAVLTPIGYKELFPYFENKMSLEECLDKIRQKSRHYAKRQYTWFNNQMAVKWFDVDFNNFEQTIEKIEYYINEEVS